MIIHVVVISLDLIETCQTYPKMAVNSIWVSLDEIKTIHFSFYIRRTKIFKNLFEFSSFWKPLKKSD